MLVLNYALFIDPALDSKLIITPIEATFVVGTNNSLSCNVTDPATFRYY